MAEQQRRTVFNLYPQPNFQPEERYLYTNDPVLRLDEVHSATRNSAQRETLRQQAAPDNHPLFGGNLDWAFRGYIVHRLLGGDDPADALAGTAPVQAVDQPARRHQIEQQWLADRTSGQPLCLFNVIVALEWIPSPRYLRRLQWAFQRASDFLYDVSDGMMAFGQVVFGGPEYMACADMQIMASNRFHPRSWTNGLHDPVKYMPIRAGRGIWHKNNRVSIPWDEPEAYRTIVHEWAHYALSLKDEYLNREPVRLVDTQSQLLAYADSGTGDFQTVVPTIRLVVDSIMAALASSELVPQSERRSRQRKLNEWAKLAEKAEFGFLGITADHQPLDGPMRLPLPLPHFVDLTGSAQSTADAPRSDGMLLTIPETQINPEHCWIYLVRGSIADPQQLIAQGSVDTRAGQDGFRLLGAQQGDTVVLIGLTPTGAPVVLRGAIGASQTDQNSGEVEAIIQRWENATPPAFPIVDVVPAPAGGAKVSRISVRVNGAGEHTAQVWVFPLGGAARIRVRKPDAPIEVETLDGYVLVSSRDGTRLTIAAFSQGGGPGASPPVSANPTAAGSSEGNVMLFFYDDEQQHAYGQGSLSYRDMERASQDYSSLRIVTTLNHGIAAEGAIRPRSYVFSLASNEPLPPLDPTLIMFYDEDTAQQDGQLRIFRQGLQGNWELVPTYLPRGSSFAAAPLASRSAPALFAAEGTRVERYRLCLITN